MHHASLRPPELDAPLVEAGYQHMVDWLCYEMPAWILDGGTEPAPPSPKSGEPKYFCPSSHSPVTLSPLASVASQSRPTGDSYVVCIDM